MHVAKQAKCCNYNDKWHLLCGKYTSVCKYNFQVITLQCSHCNNNSFCLVAQFLVFATIFFAFMEIEVMKKEKKHKQQNKITFQKKLISIRK